MSTLKAARDNTAGYSELYQAHYTRVLRLSRLLLSDRDEAEDVSQEVFLKLLKEHHHRNLPAEWDRWIVRVTVNACRDRRRSGWWKWLRASNKEFEESNHPSSVQTPEELMLNGEIRNRIWRSLQELSPRQKNVLVLRHIEGWSTQEVADTLGISAGSVKRHLFRAASHLRKALRDRHDKMSERPDTPFVVRRRRDRP